MKGNDPMNLTKFLSLVPRVLASKPSIIIFMGLFVKGLEPSDTIQLVLGNYTNVTSATGASIAAGAGLTTVATTSAVLNHVRNNGKKYDELKKSHDELTAMVRDLHRTIHKP
jgi:hypothetical protein